MDLTGKRKLAASLLKCGVGRVWIDPDRVEEVMDATTRADIRNLIRDGAIRKLQKRGVSRVRARHREQQKKKGRRRGVGSRKGAAKARLSKKSRWMTKIRAQRRSLRWLKTRGTL
jgi:large subunit ribosomal protein L19e